MAIENNGAASAARVEGHSAVFTALRKLLASGTKLRPFPPAVMEASFKAAKELHSEVSAANANFKKVYDSITAFSNSGYQWFQVAEVGYDNFMARHSQS